MDTAYDHVLSRLKCVRRSGKGWKALCPVHETDASRRHSPSLWLYVGRNGALVPACKANCGCDFRQIVDALGLEVKDFFPTDGDPLANHRRERRPMLVCTYDYKDANGVLLYQVVRFEPKDFRCRRPVRQGEAGEQVRDGFVYNMEGVRRVLYRLPELLAADPAKWVFVVEGEKDADRLTKLGLVATCNPGGAGKWHPSYSEALRARNCLVVADNDPAGQQHAQLVCNALLGVAKAVKYIELPGVPEKGDVSEYLSLGKSKDDLIHLVTASPFLTQPFALAEPSPKPASTAARPATGGSLAAGAANKKLTARDLCDLARLHLSRDSKLVLAQTLLCDLMVDLDSENS